MISTYVAGIPELLDASCGWIVPAGSVDALVHALRDALRASPETLNAMGVEGRRRSLARHDVTVSAAQLKALFERHAAAVG